jgi:ankyrin repeat protein
MLSFLLSLGANPEQRDEAGRTAILGIPWMQTLQKRKQALDILVKVGGNINARDNDGNGLLYYLILHNDLPLFKYVLQAYGKIIQLDLKNNNADAPIDIARRLRRSEFVKILSNI